MGLIKLLDKDTINKIAAGEVVDRPSSVVKELIENAIDAGAHSITCEIKDGGKSFIRITDDGSGIAKEDIEPAFLRHSTSKISCEEDLTNIKSLGFRGEALSSISAVSKVEMLTKRADDFLGSRYVIEGGEVKSFEEAGCPDGTTFIVRDIFYNTPARRKFLKSGATEAGYIGELINRLAASNPSIAFRFINQGKTVLFTNGNGNEKDALYSIYGRETAANLIAVSYESELLSIHGYIGKPVIVKGSRICENYYINGRYSKSNVITKAIEEAYKGYVMQHKFPFTSLHFTFPMDKLDVNVHPAKMEVRLSDGEYYFASICRIINDVLRSSNMIVDISAFQERNEKKTEMEAMRQALSEMPQSFETERLSQSMAANSKNGAGVNQPEINSADTPLAKNSYAAVPVHEKKPSESITLNDKSAARSSDVDVSADKDFQYKVLDGKAPDKRFPGSAAKAGHVSENAGYAPKPLSVNPSDGSDNFTQLSFDVKDEFMQDKEAENFKIIGQIFSTYWLIEMKDNLFIIDQHAAHEKILYERTVKRYREQNTVSQQLYPPIMITLSLTEEDILNRYMNYFNRLGFEISHFGGREYAINSIPCDLFSFSGDVFFHDVLDQLINTPVKGDIDIVTDRIAEMSCKAAIKGNHSYSLLEAESLIKELLKLDNPYHCPHGRPIIITMSKRELEKKFKRII